MSTDMQSMENDLFSTESAATDSQDKVEAIVDKAIKILKDAGLSYFVVGETSKFGASGTRDFGNKKSASFAVRKAHVEWEKKNKIDPDHDRRGDGTGVPAKDGNGKFKKASK
jgi:hypothetical protein